MQKMHLFFRKYVDSIISFRDIDIETMTKRSISIDFEYRTVSNPMQRAKSTNFE